eukprot:g6182.t1 g6182   contig20:1016324-1019061(+)
MSSQSSLPIKKVVIATTLLIILVGTINNAKRVHVQLTSIMSGQTEYEEGLEGTHRRGSKGVANDGGKRIFRNNKRKGNALLTSSTVAGEVSLNEEERIDDGASDDEDDATTTTTTKTTPPSCLTAHKNTIPPTLFTKLPKPYINLGFPKMGTSSLHAFFECGGLTSLHYRCGRNHPSCAKCMLQNLNAELPLLSEPYCGQADSYAQIDNGTFFPQISLLDEIHKGYPNATFFLTFRSMEAWYRSISHWPPRPGGPHMVDRFKKLDLPGLPADKGDNLQEFSDWYCQHVERCWSKANTLRMHREMDTLTSSTKNKVAITTIHQLRKLKVVQKDTDDNEYPDEEQNDGAESNLEDSDDDKDDDDASGDIDESNIITTNRTSHYFNAECFRARANTVPSSLYGKLPKPYINLGFPKMGSSSLFSFFRCGGYKSTHFYCGKGGEVCAKCIDESVSAGLTPLAKCTESEVHTQIDNGVEFPQIEHLEKLVHGTNATFFLTFRSMEAWYRSLQNWPPDPQSMRLTNQLKMLNITGFQKGVGKDIWEFSEWFCNHVTRVREIVAQNPSHTLLEVDIEDPNMGERMENIFRVDKEKQCWKQVNVNHNIHADVNLSEVILSDYHVRKEKLLTGECFQARNDSVPLSLYRNLSKPFINLGFPKMGTSALHKYFKCGGLKSTHYICGEELVCTRCIEESIDAGLPPFELCPADVYAQIDNGIYFPQVERLEEILAGYNGTFFLTFRGMEAWYRSLCNWPPNTAYKRMSLRLKDLNITGFPKGIGRDVFEFGKWYCKHVERVRKLIAKNPSQTLVEVDIEDPNKPKMDWLISSNANRRTKKR